MNEEIAEKLNRMKKIIMATRVAHPHTRHGKKARSLHG
jgi:hypothetical protein